MILRPQIPDPSLIIRLVASYLPPVLASALTHNYPLYGDMSLLKCHVLQRTFVTALLKEIQHPPHSRHSLSPFPASTTNGSHCSRDKD